MTATSSCIGTDLRRRRRVGRHVRGYVEAGQLRNCARIACAPIRMECGRLTLSLAHWDRCECRIQWHELQTREQARISVGSQRRMRSAKRDPPVAPAARQGVRSAAPMHALALPTAMSAAPDAVTRRPDRCVCEARRRVGVASASQVEAAPAAVAAAPPCCPPYAQSIHAPPCSVRGSMPPDPWGCSGGNGANGEFFPIELMTHGRTTLCIGQTCPTPARALLPRSAGIVPHHARNRKQARCCTRLPAPPRAPLRG